LLNLTFEKRSDLDLVTASQYGAASKMGAVLVTYRGIIASIFEASREYYELGNMTLRSLLDSVANRHGYDLRKLVKDNPMYFVVVDGKLVDLDKDPEMELPDACRVDIMTGVAGGERQV